MSINSVCISGNLTKDAELRYTTNQTPVAMFTVAVNDRRKNQRGEWEDYAHFIDCKMFGVRAEKIKPILPKGTKVCVAGKLEYSSWEKDGQRRSRIEVIIDQIEIMRKKQEEPSAEPQYYSEDVPF